MKVQGDILAKFIFNRKGIEIFDFSSLWKNKVTEGLNKREHKLLQHGAEPNFIQNAAIAIHRIWGPKGSTLSFHLCDGGNELLAELFCEKIKGENARAFFLKHPSKILGLQRPPEGGSKRGRGKMKEEATGMEILKGRKVGLGGLPSPF